MLELLTVSNIDIFKPPISFDGIDGWLMVYELVISGTWRQKTSKYRYVRLLLLIAKERLIIESFDENSLGKLRNPKDDIWLRSVWFEKNRSPMRLSERSCMSTYSLRFFYDWLKHRIIYRNLFEKCTKEGNERTKISILQCKSENWRRIIG